MTADANALLQSNLMFLAETLPEVLERPELLAAQESEAAFDELGRVVNVRLPGDRLLYPEGGAAVLRQVETYLADPTRFVFQDAEHVNTLPDRTREWLDRQELTLTVAPDSGTGILFVIGLGLGLHLPGLIAGLQPRFVVVIEPVPDFFAHSLHCVDWAGINADLQQRGGELKLIVDSDPLTALLGLRIICADLRWVSEVDGSYLYVHYQSEAVGTITDGLVPMLVQAGYSKGFVADERLMMVNTLTNLRTYSFHGLTAPPGGEPAMPVFIIGAGPSLDEALPTIKAYQDRALIVSCGTTLSLLLKNGIRPHVQVELENTPLVYQLTAALAEQHDLRSIHLIATTTVDPRVPGLFGDASLFVREGGCASQVAKSLRPLAAAEPNVVNAAFAALCLLGFRHFYLFGIDLGRHADKPHHAKNAVYYNVLSNLDERIEREFVLSMPGNFGGTVMTSLRLEAAKAGMELLQAVLETRLFNCSDGIAITGAAPLRPKAVKLPRAKTPPAAVLRQALAALPAYAPGQLTAGLDFTAAAQRARHLAERLATAFQGSSDGDSRRLVDRTEALLASQGNPEAAILTGSLWSVVRLMDFLAKRIEDPAARRAFLQQAEQEAAAAAVELAEATAAVLDECQACIS
jgi:hypothetical protein